jgi:hypothetical protein
MEEIEWFQNPNLVQRPGCDFQASGAGFAAEEFLENTTFDARQILYRGTLDLPDNIKRKFEESEPGAAAVFEDTYLLLKVSDSGESETQLADATLFLTKYRDEIRRLSEFPKVEMISLKFTPAEGAPPLETLPDDFWELVSDAAVSTVMF